MRINVKVTLLMLYVGMVANQTVENCMYSTGDDITGTYCTSCNGSVCTKCHNGFVDNGRCTSIANRISNCY